MLRGHVAIVWLGPDSLTLGQTCKYSSALSLGQTIATFQHNIIPALLAQHLKAQAKRSQYLNDIFCEMLSIENRTSELPWRNIDERTWPNKSNINQHPQMLHGKFDCFQIRVSNTHDTR